MSDKLTEVMAGVNDALPEYGRGIITPEEMQATRTASCFGRLAAIGAGLIVEGTDPESMGWLISLSHGIEYKPQNYWLGHVFLTLVEPQSQDYRLIDSTNQALLRDTSATSWRPSDNSRKPFVDFIVLNEIIQGEGGLGHHTPDTGESIQYAQAWALRSFFAKYSYAEGLHQYQQAHPQFAAPSLEMADYDKFYQETIRQGSLSASRI
jgi:hypothetical protein